METFFERPLICSENRSNKRDQHYYAQMVCFKLVYQRVYFHVFPNITIRGTSRYKYYSSESCDDCPHVHFNKCLSSCDCAIFEFLPPALPIIAAPPNSPVNANTVISTTPCSINIVASVDPSRKNPPAPPATPPNIPNGISFQKYPRCHLGLHVPCIGDMDSRLHGMYDAV